MAELREQDDNKMVAFNAAKELAGSPSDQAVVAAMSGVAFSIQIISNDAQQPAIDLTPVVKPVVRRDADG